MKRIARPIDLLVFLSMLGCGTWVPPAAAALIGKYLAPKVFHMPMLPAPTAAYFHQVNAPISLTGSLTNPDVSVTDTLQTTFGVHVPFDKTYKMTTGFNFFAEGAVRYDYQATYDFSIGLPNVVYPGMKFAFHPHVGSPTAAQVSGSQNGSYGTNWFFRGDIPFDGNRAINWTVGLDENLINGLPNGIDFDLAGSLSIATSPKPSGFSTNGTEAIARSYYGSDTAWSAGMDILTALSYIPIPVVGAAAGTLDASGFDLELGVGSNVFRGDIARLDNFEFANALVEVPSAALAPGDFLTLDGSDLGLQYDVGTQSLFDYSVDLELSFDHPLIPEISLMDQPLSRWFVGSASRFFDDVLGEADDWSFALRVVNEEVFRSILGGQRPDGTYALEEIEEDVWAPHYVRTPINCNSVLSCLAIDSPFLSLPNALSLVYSSDGTGNTTAKWAILPGDLRQFSPIATDTSTIKPAFPEVTVSAAPVPEPSTIILLLVGLTGLGMMSSSQRKRLQRFVGGFHLKRQPESCCREKPQKAQGYKGIRSRIASTTVLPACTLEVKPGTLALMNADRLA